MPVEIIKNSVKSTDINYISGLLEGEGCFGFYACPVIQIQMTDPDPIIKLRNLMAPHVRIRTDPRSKHNHNNKDQYVLHFSGILAIEWMMTIYSLMSRRRKLQIKSVIEKWKLMTSHNQSLTKRSINKMRGLY